MDFNSWYSSHFESRLLGRYVALKHISCLLEEYKVSLAGNSELGKPIPLIKIGHGKIKVLAWSQMHGNESTTTKAIFDFLKFINQKEFFQKEIQTFCATYSLHIIPILNPDGAELYTRTNANGVDLNRDAQVLSQKESRVLRSWFDTITPDLCLNMHDQRSIYGLGTGLPATISFLAPAADEMKSITKSRKLAMAHIERMNECIQNQIPGEVGRYNDVFNSNCVGDTFQKSGVPTLLFEAGHSGVDYQRIKTREFIFYSLLELFHISKSRRENNFTTYFEIPENKENYCDFILRNVRIEGMENPISIGIQYSETLKNDEIIFEPLVAMFGNLDKFYGHKEVNGNGADILINSQERIEMGQKVSIIVNKNERNVIYFQ